MAIVVPIIAEFVDKGLEDAKKSISEAESGWAKTGKAMEALAGPSKAIVAGMAAAGFKVAKMAGASEKANKKLAASFEAVGYPQNAAAAAAYAEQLQHVIGISDEEIKATMQKLAAYKDVAASQDMMARATMAAADISAAGFGTMDQAATQLGKALQDPAHNLGALTRMGVAFTAQQKDQIKAMAEAGDVAGAQAMILKQVEGTFGGVAEASASGSAKMKLAWQEAGEALGTALVPFLGIATELLKRLGQFANENSKAFLLMATAVGGLATAIVAINAGMKVYTAVMAVANGVSKLFGRGKAQEAAATTASTAATVANTAATSGWTVATIAATVAQKAMAVASKVAAVAVKAFGIAMKVASGPIGLIIAAVTLLAVVIVKNWDKIKAVTLSVWNWIKNFLGSTWDWLKNKCQAIWDAIVNVVKRAWDVIKKVVQLNPFIFVLTHMDKVKDWVGNALDWVKGKVQAVWGAIKNIVGNNPFDAVRGFLETLKGWFNSAIDAILGRLRSFVDSVKGIVSSVKSMVQSAKDAVKSIPRPGKNSATGAGGSVAVSRVLAMPVTRSMAEGVAPANVPVREGGSGGPGIVINVNGALDPERVARQIRQLLDTHDRRNGRTVLRAVAF